MPTGHIRTKSVYDPVAPDDGFRILVTRYHPRVKGFKKGVGYKEWLKNLSPIGPAVKRLKAGKMTELEFGKQYITHLNNSSDAQRELERIYKLLGSGETVTLLCYEPEGKFCHRHLLKKYLNKKQADYS